LLKNVPDKLSIDRVIDAETNRGQCAIPPGCSQEKICRRVKNGSLWNHHESLAGSPASRAAISLRLFGLTHFNSASG
jgi:hypothetical protein